MDSVSALLVTKEPSLCSRLCQALTRHDRLQFHTCAGAAEALAALRQHPIQILYTDLWLADGSGIDLIQQALQTAPQLYILAGASTGCAQDVMAAMQAGAADFIIDPGTTGLLEAAFDKAVGAILDHRPPGPDSRDPEKRFMTQDKAVLAMLEMAKRVAPSTATVLITGESGTGKELLAAFIHGHSHRSSEPYTAINCAALPEQLAESELFGHEKGAFTGAFSRKIGRFESADNGTLVLDEITEMALPLQAKLLRALQEKEIVRVGGTRAIPIQARVIAVSNRNMPEAVRSGLFRADLYHRLNVIPLTIPPLRERKSDIALLADLFLKRFSSQNSTPMQRISGPAMAALTAYPWPGNVRELENTIQRGVLIGDGDEMLPDHLMLDASLDVSFPTASVRAGMTVREMEKELIFNTLDDVNDNRTHAAKMLGISIRTLRNKLNEYQAERRSTAD
jgi:DNA-binding NtrC family response regulator